MSLLFCFCFLPSHTHTHTEKTEKLGQGILTQWNETIERVIWRRGGGGRRQEAGGRRQAWGSQNDEDISIVERQDMATQASRTRLSVARPVWLPVRVRLWVLLPHPLELLPPLPPPHFNIEPPKLTIELKPHPRIPKINFPSYSPHHWGREGEKVRERGDLRCQNFMLLHASRRTICNCVCFSVTLLWLPAGATEAKEADEMGAGAEWFCMKRTADVAP